MLDQLVKVVHVLQAVVELYLDRLDLLHDAQDHLFRVGVLQKHDKTITEIVDI